MQISSKKTCVVRGTELGLISAVIPKENIPYFGGGTISLGSKNVHLPSCATKAEFIDKVNDSRILHIRDDHGNWRVSPSEGEYGESGQLVNVFESEHGVKKRLYKSGANYILTDVADLDQITAPMVHFEAAHTTGTNNYKSIGNSTGVSSIDSSPAVTGKNMPILYPGVVAGKKQAPQMDPAHSTGVHADTSSLVSGDVFTTKQTLNAGRFIIPLWNANEGLMVNSQCFFQIRNRHKILFGFRMRILYKDVKFANVIADLPLECKELSIELSNNKVQVWGTTNGVKALHLQGTLTIPADSRLSVVAHADCSVPTLWHQELINPPSGKASICLAWTSPSSDSTYKILESGTTNLTVAANVLHVNNVNTGITVASATNYVLAASYDGPRVEATSIQLATGATLQYQSATDEASFQETTTSSTTMLGVNLGEDMSLGEFVWLFDNSDKLEKQILARVLSTTWSARDITLGPFDAGTNTFSVGATLVDDKLTFGTEYTRIAPTISSHVSRVLRCPTEVISSIVGGAVFDSRVKHQRIHIFGPKVEGLKDDVIWEGKSVDGHVECKNITFHKFSYPGAAVVKTSWIDSASGGEKFYEEDTTFSIQCK